MKNLKLPKIINPLENFNDVEILLSYDKSKSTSYSYVRGKYGIITIYHPKSEKEYQYRIDRVLWESFYGQHIKSKGICIEVDKKVETWECAHTYPGTKIIEIVYEGTYNNCINYIMSFLNTSKLIREKLIENKKFKHEKFN
jgi:hypothetical protein